jgi:hypothetical protein
VHWLESLAAYAVKRGLVIYPFRLNFKGQNIGLFSAGRCRASPDIRKDGYKYATITPNHQVNA